MTHDWIIGLVSAGITAIPSVIGLPTLWHGQKRASVAANTRAKVDTDRLIESIAALEVQVRENMRAAIESDHAVMDSVRAAHERIDDMRRQ